MPHLHILSFLLLYLFPFSWCLNVPHTPALTITSNETFGALSAGHRCPPVNQRVHFEEDFYDGREMQPVTLLFSSGESRRPVASQGEMRAVVSCYNEFQSHILASSSRSGVSTDPLFCLRYIRNTQGQKVGRLVFRFLPYTDYLDLPNMSKDLGLELVEFLRRQLHDCARNLDVFWTSGRYSVNSNANIAEIGWDLQR